jgi:hypothetical protein
MSEPANETMMVQSVKELAEKNLRDHALDLAIRIGPAHFGSWEGCIRAAEAFRIYIATGELPERAKRT